MCTIVKHQVCKEQTSCRQPVVNQERYTFTKRGTRIQNVCSVLDNVCQAAACTSTVPAWPVLPPDSDGISVMCLRAPPLAPVSHWFTLAAKRSEHSVSFTDAGSQLMFTNIKVFPSPPRHGCNTQHQASQPPDRCTSEGTGQSNSEHYNSASNSPMSLALSQIHLLQSVW